MPVTITEYVRAHSLKDALGLLGESHPRSVAVGGGVSVSLSGAPKPVRAIDLHCLGLDKIEQHEGKLRIGATVTLSDLIRAPELQRPYSGVIPAGLRTAASLPIRNLITVGGNIVQCYYWSTLPPLLLALDGHVVLVRAESKRTVSAAEFFQIHPVKFLQRGEIVTRVEIPLEQGRHGRRGAEFLKFSRTGNDYAWVHACAVIGLERGKVSHCRLVLSALGALPVRCERAEQMLIGSKLDEKAVRESARAAAHDVHIRRDMRASAEYRRTIAAEYLERAIVAAGEKARD
jgi:CO/xanthine dehydrogenase FAD-binding subunit